MLFITELSTKLNLLSKKVMEPQFKIDKVNYENLITTKVALEELDNHFKKVHTFKLR